MKKVVYIGYMPLTKKSSKDFFVEDIINERIAVEYWDLTSLFFPHLKLKDTLQRDFIKIINSLKDFKLLLSKEPIEETVFFVNFRYEGRVLKVYRLLTKKNAKYCIIAKGMMPLPTIKKRSFIELVKKISFNKINNLILNKIALLYKNVGLVKAFDVIYYAGIESIKIAGIGYLKDKEKAKLIEINSSDYDIYLSIDKTNRLVSKKYIVFLDEYLPFHPDFFAFGIKTIKADKYYQSLNSFFVKIEKKFNSDIIIAAHPKSQLYTEKDFFNGRQVIFYKTAELVKDAEFVIGHMSTSISFSVLFNKPLLFIYDNAILQEMYDQFKIISHFAKTLGSLLINIDTDNLNELPIIRINLELYNNYKYKYITSQTNEMKTSSQIFIDSIICL